MRPRARRGRGVTWQLALAVLLIVGGPSHAQAAAAETLGLHQAVGAGAVGYRFEGNGTTFGGTLSLVNMTDKPLTIVLPTGTSFVVSSGESQPMVTGKNPPVALNPGGTWTGPLVTYCTNHFLPPPTQSDEAPSLVLGPRYPESDEVTGLIIAHDVVMGALQGDPERTVGPLEKRDPKVFWDTALLWAIYGKTQEIGQATYEESMENQLSEQVSEPRANQESHALGEEVFKAVIQIEEQWTSMKDEEVDLSDLDPTLKYRPPVENPGNTAKLGRGVSSPSYVAALQTKERRSRDEFITVATWAGRPIWKTDGRPHVVVPAVYRMTGEHRISLASYEQRDEHGDGQRGRGFSGSLYAASDQVKGSRVSPGERSDKEVALTDLDPTQKFRPPKRPAVSDEVPFAIAIPSGPIVEAYIAMAVDAHDRFRDLDAAHDWLDKALELDPDNYVAKGILDRVKAEEQQAGAQRAGAFMGAIQHMLAEQERREQERREHEGHHYDEGKNPCDM